MDILTFFTEVLLLFNFKKSIKALTPATVKVQMFYLWTEFWFYIGPPGPYFLVAGPNPRLTRFFPPIFISAKIEQFRKHALKSWIFDSPHWIWSTLVMKSATLSVHKQRQKHNEGNEVPSTMPQVHK